jgi:dCTP deaminase
MTVLDKRRISARLKARGVQRLVISPLLTLDQIGEGSVDVRLGPSIIVPRKTYVESQDPTQAERLRQVEWKLYERVRLRYHSKFVLHPNEVILGATFEYISMPQDLSCTITSRSTWGRLGLVVATAAVVHPGFIGCLTLELVNMAESPIAL